MAPLAPLWKRTLFGMRVKRGSVQGGLRPDRDCTVNGVTPIKEEHDEQAG